MAAELITIARPYAEALFRLGRETRQLARWDAFLARAVAVAKQPDVAPWLDDARLARDQLADLFIRLCAPIEPQEKNFITLLAQNRRLNLLPLVRDIFVDLENKDSRNLPVTVHSAFPLSESQRQALASQLANGGGQVHIDEQIDPQLVGGARVILGDKVYENSVHSRLHALARILKQSHS